MAFDQSTRNRLQKFVSEARSILTEEFTRQLQASFGMDPKSGDIAELDSLNFLDNQGRQTATILRQTLAHYAATISGKTEKERVKQSLNRIIREQAFTILNRLGALRMAEARGFLIESISKGSSSKGFQLYKNIAGTALGETGDAYRQYLLSLFDEFSLDLAVLFDRHSSQGRLFPRESALLALLEQINHFEIEQLWEEDETIGWIYQYFNSQEERKQMRAESSAPRNSRELAVRNQFFTPRYVVEFLTDNTLGRIWYEMTQGKTTLVETCHYLVRRPTEIFLASKEAAPEVVEDETEILSQEELLKQPVYIPFRALKDPREIRMLDPACGSMHFGLYAFDLFERIYEEAWQLEEELGADAFERSKAQIPLHKDFTSFKEFQKAIPKLIIKHNIHGVDIDPRAVQIAGLSLWLRAQRTWHQIGLKPNDRPTIRKSNIVCAEPMPGEKAMLQGITEKMNPPILGHLVETVFDKMELAGEAGTLLIIEEEIQTVIKNAKKEYDKSIETPFFLPGLDQIGHKSATDVKSDFWNTAEERIFSTLSHYAEQADSGDNQKRLFAEDTAKGFSFIDLCRKRFDVVLMNPPFGLPANTSTPRLESVYPDTYLEMYASFASRGLNLLAANGVVGSISSRAFLTVNRLQSWREKEIIDRIDVILDLGQGVMDSAMVESAAYTIRKEASSNHIIAYDATALESEQRHRWAEYDIPKYCTPRNRIISMPRRKIIYNASPELCRLFKSKNVFEPNVGTVRQGMGTFDDFRFVHLSWEVPVEYIGENNAWEPLTKGGAYSRYYADIYLVLNWNKDGAELSAVNISRNGQDAQVRQASSYWRKPGSTYSKRSQKGFSARALPSNCILTGKGPAILSTSGESDLFILGWINSRLIRSIIEMQANFGEYNTGILKQLPWISGTKESKDKEGSLSHFLNNKIRIISSIDETNAHHEKPYFCESVHKTVEQLNNVIAEVNQLEQQISGMWDDYIDTIYSIDSSQLLSEDDPAVLAHLSNITSSFVCYQLVSHSIGILFGRWSNDGKYLDNNFDRNFDAFGELPVRGKSSSAKSNTEVIFVDGFASRAALSKKLADFIDQYFGENTHQEILELLSLDSLNQYVSAPSRFFADHLKTYSASRRQAPIFWPLQTPSGSFTLWLYYHRLTEQTLYVCVNDFVEPKIITVINDLNELQIKKARSSTEEKELIHLLDLKSELDDFRDGLLKIAKLWRPNLNDGVQITAAPLWKFFQYKPWQKRLKGTWVKLERGDYDWSHLAYSNWQERVLRKCHEDRSIAIAHGVEDDFWEEVEVPIIRRGRDTGETKTEWHPRKLSETQLCDLIGQIMAEGQ